MVLGVAADGGEGTGRFRRLEASQHAWLEEEIEEAEAVRRDTSGELGAAAIGVARRRLDGARGARKRRARVRVRTGERAGVERGSRGRRRLLLIHAGGQGAGRQQGVDTATAAWRQ